MRKRRSRARRRSERSGVAAAELAVSLPVIMVIVLGTIEATSMIFLKETLTVAAYEGSRTALITGATAPQVETKCNEILAERNVQGADVTVTPNIEALAGGQYITVTISAPADQNSLLPIWYSAGRTPEVTCTVMKEY